MPYKTILMHCNDKRRIEPLLAATVTLAEKFEAHLLGLSIVPPLAIIASGAPIGPPVVIDTHCELYRAENPAMKSAFEAATQGLALTAEWREDEANVFGVAECVPSPPDDGKPPVEGGHEELEEKSSWPVGYGP